MDSGFQSIYYWRTNRDSYMEWFWKKIHVNNQMHDCTHELWADAGCITFSIKIAINIGVIWYPAIKYKHKKDIISSSRFTSKYQLSKMHDFLITHTIGLCSLTLLRVCDLNANLSHLSKSNVFVRKSAFSRKI